MSREDLVVLVEGAVRALGGQATILDVAKYIWAHNRTDLERAGDVFYTWQYDIRWAAQVLRDRDRFTFGRNGRRNVWILKG